MDELSRDYLVDFYTKSLMLHGDRPEALRWSARGQERRFSAILDSMPGMDNTSLLDYGCGKGDLYAFLNSRGVSTRYTGVDITPALINLAQSKYPECRFHVCSPVAEDIEQNHDNIIACGVFNNNIEGTSRNMLRVMKRLFYHTNKAMAITALSSRIGDKSFELSYVDPDELLQYVRDEITPEATLHETDGDIILILRKH
ncbi:class I SAM-dependent methyltransferase [Nitrospirota bacterium]